MTIEFRIEVSHEFIELVGCAFYRELVGLLSRDKIAKSPTASFALTRCYIVHPMNTARKDLSESMQLSTDSCL